MKNSRDYFISRIRAGRGFIHFMVILFLLLTGISSDGSLFGQTAALSAKPAMNAVKIEQPITLTGKLDHPSWQKAEVAELNYEIQPGDNSPASQRTTVRVLYDNENIYFGFECFDTNPEQVRANITDRDKIFQDDWVFVVLDTYGDYQRGYEFVVNPFGIQADLLASIDEDASVDWIWSSAAARHDWGWTAEMAIPFSSLHFPDKEIHEWVLNVIRTMPRSSRTQFSWVPIDRNIPAFLPQAGKLRGLKNIRSGGSVEILPYAMGQQAGSRTDIDNSGSNFAYDKFESRLGAGIRYSPNTSFSLDAVMNPDFSQIESDAGQISVNTTFALQYEEKRPFFLIGRELLQTPMYYSRSINDPAGAARIIGKTGSLSYLYMGALDRNTVFDIPGEEGSSTFGTDLNSMVNVGKLRYDFGEQSYLGGLLLTRNLTEAHNYVAGIDWRYKFWMNWYFSGEGFVSQTRELNDLSLLDESRKFGKTSYDAAFNGEKYSGTGLHLNLSHSQRSYNFSFTYNTFSPTYQTYNGSFGQTGFRQIYMSHGYTFYPEKFLIDRGSIGVDAHLRHDYYGIKRELYIMPKLNLSMKAQTYIFLGYLPVNEESFHGEYFSSIGRLFFNINSQPSNSISFYIDGQVGKFIYRNDDPALGSGHRLETGFTLKPSSQTNISFSYSRARLEDTETKELYYDGNIFRVVGIYQFSPEFFFRTIAQYNSFDREFQFYPLLSYKLNPFTTFFAGTTSNYIDYRNDAGILNTSQQYFMKLQYLFTL